MKTNHIWVVEMKLNGRWRPTIGCHLTKIEAKEDLLWVWAKKNPDDSFRVRRYSATP